MTKFLTQSISSYIILLFTFSCGWFLNQALNSSDVENDQPALLESPVTYLEGITIPEDRILYSKQVFLEGVHDPARVVFQDGSELVFSYLDYDKAGIFNNGGEARLVYHLDHGPCLSDMEGKVFLTCFFSDDHPLDLHIDQKFTDEYKFQSTATMVSSFDYSADLWKHEMRRSFKALLGRVSGEAADSLKESQLQWLRFKKLHAQFLNSLNDESAGTIGTVYFVDRIANLYRKRALQLLELYVF